MLHLADLLTWAGSFERAADDVRRAHDRLQTAAATMRWTSSSADHFLAQLAEHLHAMAECAAEIDEAAGALRRHHAAALAAEHALGAAAEHVVTAARAAASSGVLAVSSAVEDARQEFAEAARAVLDTAEDGVDRLQAVRWQL